MAMSTATTEVVSATAKLLIVLLFFQECSCRLEFLTQPESAVVGPNLPLQISCTVSTNLSGILHILWKRNDTWITDYTSKHYSQLTNGSLFFERFLYGDQGTYQCSALVVSSDHTHLGQIYSRVASIKMAYIQNAFTLDPESRSVLLGNNVQLQCISPKSEPVAKIYWEKDGRRVTGLLNATLVLAAQSILSATIQIQNLSYSSTGRYRCVAYNILLMNRIVNSNYADVTIAAAQEQPYFEKRPASAIVTRFQPFTWECRIRGVPQPAIYWYHNGKLVNNETNRFMLTTGPLQFVSMQRSYNGSYVCEGKNALGGIRLSPPVALIVAFIDFEFSVNPVSKNVTYGDELVLSCSPPNRYPTPVSILWYKDFVKLTPNTNITVSSDGTLRISRITKAYEGMYFCQAHHPSTSQSRSSKRATVIVRVLPSIGTMLNNASAVVGESLSRTCQASGYPTPTVKWIRYGHVLSNDGNLHLARINLTYSGFYTCIATNVAGSASKRFYLHVSTSPAVLIAPSNATKIVGESVQFRCDFYGTPKPVVSWFFSRTQSSSRETVAYDSRVVKTSDGIRISPVRKTDEGKYICRGNSTGGSLEVFAFLRVYVPPSFVAPPSNMTTVVSSQVIFRYTATGDPVPAVSWHFSGSRLAPGPKYEISGTTFTVKGVSLGDSGWYTCKLTNMAGQRNASAFLDVQMLPYPPKQLRAVSTHANSITIFWQQGFDGYSSTLGYVLEVSLKDAGSWRVYANNISARTGNYTVIGLQPYTVYSARMKAFTVIGMSAYSVSIDIRTLEGDPSVPRSMRVQVLNSTAARAHWEKPSQTNGNITVYELQYSLVASSITRVIAVTADGSSSYQLVLRSLQPFSDYHLKIRAATGNAGSRKWGNYSTILAFRTSEAAPSAAPMLGNITAISSTSISVTFFPLQSTMLNGILQAYDIRISSTQDKEHKFLTNNTHLIVTSLRKFTRYTVTIRACTRAGCGPPSRPRSISTLEDLPGQVSNASVTVLSPTTIRISWSQPLDQNGNITGYIVAVKAGSLGTFQNISLDANQLIHEKTGLTNSTYFVTIAAKTKVGTGPWLPFIQVKLDKYATTTATSSPASSAPSTESTSPSTTLTATTKSTVGPGTVKKSVDWLDENNLPILIGVSVTIFILLIIVIVLFSLHCARRLTAGTIKRERWLSTRTQSGAENPGYLENGGLELKKNPAESADQKADQSNTTEEFVDSKIVDDDFIFEHESESQPEDNNPANGYAYDDTMRIKDKDDESPLIKLRNNELDFSDDASEYDQPYSHIDELGAPIKDLFSFVDEEDNKALDFSSNEEHSDKNSKDNSRKTSDSNQENMPESEGGKTPEVPHGRTTASPDFTWDNYDTSKEAAHNDDSVRYDTPADAVILDAGHNIPEYATVQKNRDKKQSDEFLLIGNEERI
ncbi:roundabout homolog 2-like isoform X2 [Rhopilema esculentum]|uniref:roundabout homolog 2-like isoform X2 n=1 Tax=Rhopilema esculentum TaxID=499914 RepID=UPI0031E29842